MNRRYILLSSSYRNRVDYPSQFDFVAPYQTYGNDKSRALDGLSYNAPVVQYDMGDYFATTSSFTAPYRWEQTGDVVSLIGSSPTDRFIVTIDARKNGGAPNPVTGQYVGLKYIHTSGVESTVIGFTFLNNGSLQYEIQLEDSIAVTALDTFTIATPFLGLNQSYIPKPIDINDHGDAYVGYSLVEIEEGVYGAISNFDSTTRILTNSTDFTLVAAATYPDKFFIARDARLLPYTVDAVSATDHTLEFTITDQPYDPNTLLYNYIYHYPSGVMGRILEVTIPDPPTGQFTLTISSDTDLSGISTTDSIYILMYARDNNYSLDYNPPMIETQWQDRGQVRIYDLELIWLAIPNKQFSTNPGGYPVNYPFFFIDLINESSESRTDQVIFSNSPNVVNATFATPVLDISTPDFSSFTKLDGTGMVYPFNIKSKDTLHLRIRTPDGNIPELNEADTTSPVSPNPYLQVSAMFAITSRPSSTPCFSCNPNGRHNLAPSYM